MNQSDFIFVNIVYEPRSRVAGILTFDWSAMKSIPRHLAAAIAQPYAVTSVISRVCTSIPEGVCLHERKGYIYIERDINREILRKWWYTNSELM